MGSIENLPPERRVTIMRIVLGALLSGLAIFAGMVIALRYTGHPAAPAQLVMTYVCIVFTVILALASAVVPALVAANGRRQLRDAPEPIAESEWYGMYQTQLIISASMLEGPGFFALIAFLTEGSLASLGLALFLFIIIALKMPSVPRVERWISNQQELLERERQKS
jgi:hypothetical protein